MNIISIQLEWGGAEQDELPVTQQSLACEPGLDPGAEPGLEH